MAIGKLGATLCGALLAAQAAAEPAPAEAPLFATHETLQVSIEGPLKTLIRERSDTEYYEGLLRYTDADGVAHTLDLKFRARGNYRRKKSTCRIPPVRLNFRKKQVEGTVFEGQNILKLVTHCSRMASYDQFVLKEELAYKILRLHSPISFRTRLLRVNWVDTDSNNKSDERYAFVIEHANELEQRVSMTQADVTYAEYEQMNPEQGAIAAVFEYMIGNTDFSMAAGAEGKKCCHNTLLLRAPDDQMFAVPYDFDMSGIVDAPYAAPNPRFGLRNVKARLYRGSCVFNPLLASTAALFMSKRDDVMRLVDEQPGLKNGERKQLRGFLGKFYDDISTPEQIEKLFVDKCFSTAARE